VIKRTIKHVEVPELDRGAEFIPGNFGVTYRPDWFVDGKLEGICNHSTREHMPRDLHRYLYAACFAQCYGQSPRLRDFPTDLLPDHDNVHLALNGHGFFADRFRVQVGDRCATTITSHMAKDGHGFIHPDPKQCRSLTVREAARLQTFPDNYLFCGPRTQKYVQVGNAVPPLLAQGVARIVWTLLQKTGLAR
jgi:DNA (cytosine-5)-methyltransferase 1